MRRRSRLTGLLAASLLLVSTAVPILAPPASASLWSVSAVSGRAAARSGTLQAPAYVTAVCNSVLGVITVTWNAVPGATGYNVYLYPSQTLTGSSTTTSWTSSALKVGYYQYEVTATAGSHWEGPAGVQPSQLFCA